uniref:IMS import disulfide relay-system CHCH-CHCH-like Cx9C domain-containing protein n=1 Tax=Hemiselmis tepida TaxID=464990 RepID=A0A7S0VJD2_9CRYP
MSRRGSSPPPPLSSPLLAKTDANRLDGMSDNDKRSLTYTSAGDGVMHFERLLLRFETMVGNCGRELRKFNEVTLTLGKEHESAKEHYSLLAACQKASEARMAKVKGRCRDLNDAYSHCLQDATGPEGTGVMSCLPMLQNFVACSEKALGNPPVGEVGTA